MLVSVMITSCETLTREKIPLSDCVATFDDIYSDLDTAEAYYGIETSRENLTLYCEASDSKLFTYQFTKDSILTTFYYTDAEDTVYKEYFDDYGYLLQQEGRPISIYMSKYKGNYFLNIFSFSIINDYRDVTLITSLGDTEVVNINEASSFPYVDYYKIYLANVTDDNANNYEIALKYVIDNDCDNTKKLTTDTINFTLK